MKMNKLRKAEKINEIKEASVGVLKAALKNLAGMRKLFGPKGEHWIQGSYDDWNGNYCLVGAADKLNGQGEIVAKATMSLFVSKNYHSVEAFNDAKGRKFPEILKLIGKAENFIKAEIGVREKQLAFEKKFDKRFNV